MLSNSTDWLSAGLALLGVLGLIGLAAMAARARGWGGTVTRPGRAGRELALEEVLALDRERRLLLVRCGGRRVLLLVGGGADVVVGWPKDAPDGDAPDGDGADRGRAP